MTRRFDAGAAIVVRRPGDPANGSGTAGEPSTLLFVISPAGQLRIATAGAAPAPSEADTTIWLGDGQAANGPAPPAFDPSD
jgi:hypothetical protein